ncbi:penicillin-binding protein activator [Roseicitreum antarcticum]|uniref:Amino acid/amide ABC transporter substrate-binding protein, HAAT family (TC 3.A.1.4.-) n=1 Tax=Roseicitreum antarcticum TaxID=564137 RepID=A0A1H2SJU5_9RHOB|nr:penicillin-binding protein activator [Roseicitreum antarcticum]SDW31404.1 amino acid/amide ABC transporter substrate-binding protein, HAAT family (TC 3.A.1.4.-) [Roseicitreum antarcticum]
MLSMTKRIIGHVRFAARRSAGFLGLAALVAACAPGAMGPTAGPRVNPNAPVTVALLVPGGSADAGRNTLAANLENATRMAIADLQGVQIDLRVYNTAGSPAQAAEVTAQAISDGAAVILGPVFGDAAAAAGRVAAQRNINVLSFSNNTDIAGGNVFVLGATFENTAQRMLSYAVSQGKGRVAIVAERTAEGQIAETAIRTAAGRTAASLTGTVTYEFSQQGVVNALPQISSTVRSGGAQSIFFTANTAGALPLLAQLLPENSVGPTNYQFMGLTRWDIPAATLSLSGVQGGWFALPDPALTSQFEARYTAAYGTAPHPIAGLGYDGVAAIGALLRNGGSDALTGASLTQGSGFLGVNGAFRLRSDGTNERALAIASIENNEVVIIDPAPRSFTGSGF